MDEEYYPEPDGTPDPEVLINMPASFMSLAGLAANAVSQEVSSLKQVIAGAGA